MIDRDTRVLCDTPMCCQELSTLRGTDYSVEKAALHEGWKTVRRKREGLPSLHFCPSCVEHGRYDEAAAAADAGGEYRAHG